MAKTDFTSERLRQALHYDRETGIFTRKVASACALVGARADHIQTSGGGRRRIAVCGKRYFAHQLAWLYVHGVWPPHEVDHRDGDPSNNRLANLRLAEHCENHQNRRHPQAGNKSGFLGVTEHNENGRFKARITIDGVGKHIGYFSTPEAAHAAYLKAKSKLHPFQTLVPTACSK